MTIKKHFSTQRQVVKNVVTETLFVNTLNSKQ